MEIQIDSREKKFAIRDIVKTFDRCGVHYFVSKLYCGDYMSLDNPRLVVDRKQNLFELCSNVCQDHVRFRNEMIRAKEHGIKIIFLCEHGNGIKTLDDVFFWVNPHGFETIKINGQWRTIKKKTIHGDKLYKILCTMQKKYGVTFLFCDKSETGQRIIEILRGDSLES